MTSKPTPRLPDPAPRICLLASINLDLVVRTETFPSPGETVHAHSLQRYAGGKGANQAVAAARLGAPVAVLGCVGDDEAGSWLHQALQNEGVDCSDLEIVPDCPSGTALITVDDRGDNHIVVVAGANAHPCAEWVQQRGAAITAADVLLLQLESPLAAVQAAAHIAHQAGVRVLLNAAPAPTVALPAELLACVDLLLVNQVEAMALGKIEAQRVVTTLGAQGSRWTEADGAQWTRAGYPVSCVDTTAAGDAFAAALACSWAAGADPESALAYANATGALACTRPGAQASLPYREQVENLLRGTD